MVEPRHPFEGRQFHRFPCPPRAAPVNQFRLVQPIDRLGQGVVLAVVLAAHGGFNTCFGETLAVADADVLRAPV